MCSKISTSKKVEIVEGGIEKREQFYRQIVQHLKGAFYSCNADGFITFFNEDAATLWGQRPELGLQKWCGSWKLFLTDGQPLSIENSPMAVALKKGSPLSGQELILERKDGSRRKVIADAQPVFETSGKIMGGFTILIDITEEIEKAEIVRSKKNQEELAVINSQLNDKNEELQKINVDLDNFIYTASHDLKAPVTNIEGLIYALTETVKSQNPSKEELIRILQMMKKSIDRFSKTIRDLTTITKIQKDTEEEVPEEVDLQELIEDIKFLNGDLIANSGTKIFVDPKNLVNISFSRKNLKSVLYNLITNAIKYRSHERTPQIRIFTEKKDGYIVLNVQDNGLGLEEHKQKKLFSMFRRFHDHVDGTGIGLYLVKRIVTNAGGKVEVESKLNIGSTFKIYFKEAIV